MIVQEHGVTASLLPLVENGTKQWPSPGRRESRGKSLLQRNHVWHLKTQQSEETFWEGARERITQPLIFYRGSPLAKPYGELGRHGELMRSMQVSLVSRRWLAGQEGQMELASGRARIWTWCLMTDTTGSLEYMFIQQTFNFCSVKSSTWGAEDSR